MICIQKDYLHPDEIEEMKELEKEMDNKELDKLLNCLLIFDGSMRANVLFTKDIERLINA